MRITSAISKILVFTICFFNSQLCLAESPFYLTAEKSFSPEENATIRLNFNNRNIPIKIRLLKPTNVDEYLTGQIQLSRSYEDPVGEINAGHYFWNGFDKINNPFHIMRRMLSPSFRNKVATNFKQGLISKNNPSFHVDQPFFRIGIPKKTKLLNEFYLSLQKDTGSQTTDGQNIDSDNFNNSSLFMEKNINLGHQAPGIYIVQAIQGNDEAQCIFQVSNYLASAAPV